MRTLIINPVKCKCYNDKMYNAYCKIELSDDGRLSICGVIGPMNNGDCKGSAGQCVDEIRQGMPTEEWTPEMLKKFCNIWDEWHLNDMHPECEHQRELGWNEQAKEKVILYHYKLNDESIKLQKQAKEESLAALKNGETFTPTKEQSLYASLEYFYDTYEKIEDNSELAKYYVPYKSCTGTPVEETKTRGWVRFEESPLGMLGKPCPVCGYQYGSSWNKVEVPQEIIDWLFNLPKTKTQPAWV